MAFVVPAEIGHAGYAAPLIEYLSRSFRIVHFVAIQNSVFSELSQDVWLLFADGYGDSTEHLSLTTWTSFRKCARPPRPNATLSLLEWRNWSNRLRPFILPKETLDLYQHLAAGESTLRLGTVAQVGIGYVTGANDFFHLRPSVAKSLQIPDRFLVPTVRNGRSLPAHVVDNSTVSTWAKRDEPFLLLRLRPEDAIPSPVRRYLNSIAARTAKESYKCRNRQPWYAVPDVTTPDGFLAYMSGREPFLVSNAVGCACTNSVHAVRMRNGCRLRAIQSAWSHSLTRLSTELEGHPLGGGLLKLEPREAARIVVPKPKLILSRKDTLCIERGISELREWRHHG